MIICVVQMFSLGISTDGAAGKHLWSAFTMVVLAITAKNFVNIQTFQVLLGQPLISFVLTLPVSPLSDFIVGTVGKFNFSLVDFPLLLLQEFL